MGKLKLLILVCCVAGASFVAGGIFKKYYHSVKDIIILKVIGRGSDAGGIWQAPFQEVQIQSSIDSHLQKAYFFPSDEAELAPLVVSMHSWSGDYSQGDRLAKMAVSEGWNYIHPDYRGVNWTKDACLSEKVLSDIDDAIDFAIKNGSVDTSNIYMVGESGGGYAALGTYLNSQHDIKAFLTYVPITDLSAWYFQSKHRNLRYAYDVLDCTSDGGELDVEEANRRSPLFMEIPSDLDGKLEIFTGIYDGYSGTVPISHSLLFYNRIAEHFGRTDSLITDEEMLQLLTRGVEKEKNWGEIQGKEILYKREAPEISITIFDGGHDYLYEHAMKRIKEFISDEI